MPAKSLQEYPNNPDQGEVYAHGYDSALTLKFHASRTADKQAGWFLPYLQPGMTLLDCGCASGSITLGLAKVVAPGQVTGVDLSEIEIERAQARAAEAGITNLCFAVGNIYQLDRTIPKAELAILPGTAHSPKELLWKMQGSLLRSASSTV